MVSPETLLSMKPTLVMSSAHSLSRHATTAAPPAERTPSASASIRRLDSNSTLRSNTSEVVATYAAPPSPCTTPPTRSATLSEKRVEVISTRWPLSATAPPNISFRLLLPTTPILLPLNELSWMNVVLPALIQAIAPP